MCRQNLNFALNNMKRSDQNHLRRLLGWLKTEIGQSPDEVVQTLTQVTAKLGLQEADFSEAAKARMVATHDRARNVPGYVRAAITALEKTLGAGAVVAQRDSAIGHDAPARPFADSTFNTWYASLTEAERTLYQQESITGMQVAFNAGQQQARAQLPNTDEGGSHGSDH